MNFVTRVMYYVHESVVNSQVALMLCDSKMHTAKETELKLLRRLCNREDCVWKQYFR